MSAADVRQDLFCDSANDFVLDVPPGQQDHLRQARVGQRAQAVDQFVRRSDEARDVEELGRDEALLVWLGFRSYRVVW